MDTNILTQQEFYKEIYKDIEEGRNPDLRKLGAYKVIADPGMAVFPIDLDLSGRDLYLGDGDFTGTFVAFDNTKANTVDLGSSRFSQLYLDYLDVKTLNFNSAQASSVMFDRAKIENCDFSDFRLKELYFDELSSGEIHIRNLTADRIFVGQIKPTRIHFEHNTPDNFRILFDDSGSRLFGDITEESLRGPNYFERESASRDTAPERLLSAQEFLRLVREGSDLRTLGKYKINGEGTGETMIIETRVEQLDLGLGDFREVAVEFTNPKIDTINLDEAQFDSVGFVGGNIELVDMAKAKANTLYFRDSKLGTIYCDGMGVDNCVFIETEIEYVFLNNFSFRDLKFDGAKIGEIFASRGEHGNIVFKSCDIRLFNGHEAKFQGIDFGESIFGRVVLRATSVDGVVEASDLKTGLFMIGYYDNAIEELRVTEATLGTKEGIETLVFKKIEPNELDKETFKRRQEHIPNVYKGIKLKELGVTDSTLGTKEEIEPNELDRKRVEESREEVREIPGEFKIR
jgi:uncharacterized protein YjbI with pentapeptide repeats